MPGIRLLQGGSDDIQVGGGNKNFQFEPLRTVHCSLLSNSFSKAFAVDKVDQADKRLFWMLHVSLLPGIKRVYIYIQTGYLTGRDAIHYTLDGLFLKFIAIGLLFRGHYLITSWSYFTIRL